MACATGGLAEVDLVWRDEPALAVVMAAKGYPGSYRKGTRIEGLDRIEAMEGVKVFHAGTVRGATGLEANGGRVLNVCAIGSDVAQARARAYAAVDAIDWEDGFVRTDIAWRALSRS